MVLICSDEEFKKILSDTQFHLPKRWDGNDFRESADILFRNYREKILSSIENGNNENLPSTTIIIENGIRKVCDLLSLTIKDYLDGFPSKAYFDFERVMQTLMRQPLDVSIKDAMNEQYKDEEDILKLFRVVNVDDNIPYKRERVFHTPYTLRSKVPTCRYSIAGYPSLYLGTSLELCCEEIQRNPYENLAIASMFKIRGSEYENAHIRIIELGIKPQDFIGMCEKDHLKVNYNYLHGEWHNLKKIIHDRNVRSAYLLWYPLIACCSYIRTNKKNPFAPEYIIPQLLMQWVRNEIGASDDGNPQLVGIRYFSCASVRTSDIGFNYVFPTSGQKTDNNLYCSVLARTFQLTEPVFIHEFDDIRLCERYLENVGSYDFISR